MFTLIPLWGRLLFVAVIAAFIAFWVHHLDAAYYGAKIADVQQQYATFRADATAQAKIAEMKAEDQAKRQKEVEDAISKELFEANNSYAAVLKRLRNQSPVRPSGEQVPTATCNPQVAGGAPGAEWVPIADYRSLEERAAFDAQTVELYKSWVQKMMLAGALEVQ